MDLGAFCRIEDLEKIMVENGITIPRLRGIRLMSNEKPVSKENIDREAKTIGLYECESACESNFKWNPFCFTMSERTRKLKRKYIKYDEKHCPIDICWDAVHGYKRKLFKYNMRMAEKRVKENYSIFNKYCGRSDVLYIHARIGGRNWSSYKDEVENQPWFIEKVDDPFDSTYCDIYARITAS